MPKHIAIIMDGNGRWAKKQGFAKRTKGHKAGAKSVREITTACAKLGVKCLTLYAFSTENWKRPKNEIDFLMKMLSKYLQKEEKTYMQNNICFDIIGDLAPLGEPLLEQITHLKKATAKNTGLKQVLALNYGARNEIVRAIRTLCKTKAEINEKAITNALDTKDLPPLDLIIRTGGEQRLSNFLLWQASYSELFFTPTLWPDFKEKELIEIIENFKKRERRYGGT